MNDITEVHYNVRGRHTWGHPSHQYDLTFRVNSSGKMDRKLNLTVVEAGDKVLSSIRLDGQKVNVKEIKDDMQLYMQYMRFAAIQKNWEKKGKKKK